MSDKGGRKGSRNFDRKESKRRMRYFDQPLPGTGNAFEPGNRQQNSDELSWNDVKDRGRVKHPSHLKGREIGLWYAAQRECHRGRGRGTKKEHHEGKQERQFVAMDKAKERSISSLLSTIRGQRSGVTPNPIPSHGDEDDEDQRLAEEEIDNFSDDADDDGLLADAVNSFEEARGGDSYNSEASRSKVTSFLDRYNLPETSLAEATSRSTQRPVATTTAGSKDQHGLGEFSAFTLNDDRSFNDFSRDWEPPRTTTNRNVSSRETCAVLSRETCADLSKDTCAVWESRETNAASSRETLATSSRETCAVLSRETCAPPSRETSATSSQVTFLEKTDKKISDSADGAFVQEDDDAGEASNEMSELYHVTQDDESASSFMYEYLDNKVQNRAAHVANVDSAQCQISRDPDLDNRLKKELQERQRSNSRYCQLMEFRRKLPSFKMKERIVELLGTSHVAVISGETGCGKTTQVAQFILDDYIERGEGSLCRIVCTQPRRISAITVAERVAEERAERCGEGGSCGYQIRLEQKMPRSQGSILYCTTGILLKWLSDDPTLSKTSHVILDEIHERDLLSDFLMIILRDLLARRKDLHLILMSATLNANMFSKYFGDCPALNIPGFTFPVERFLLEDVLQLTGYFPSKSFSGRYKRPKLAFQKGRQLMQRREEFESWLASISPRYSRQTLNALKEIDTEEIDFNLVVTLLSYIVTRKQMGAILVFLPGWEDIRKVNDGLLANAIFKTGRFRIIPLHSMMPTVNQREVFERPPMGVRKIILATNIAETSITIDDVVFVVDCGKIKLKNFDLENNVVTLRPEWVSKANARQRQGRAGRVQAGECYHLYTGYQESQLADYLLPEILRTRLEELCLQIKLLKLGRIEPFIRKAMQPPALEALQLAIATLIDLNALDSNEDLTPLGYHLAKMPVDPHSGKMLLFAALFCCLDPICTVAASLSFKDAFYVPMGKEKEVDERRRMLADGSRSDHIMLANAYQGWEEAQMRGYAGPYCNKNFLSTNTLRMLKDMRRQFATLLYEMGFLEEANPKSHSANSNSKKIGVVKAIIAAGLYPNVARITQAKPHPQSGKPTLLCTKTEGRVLIHIKSVNARESQFESPWLVYHLKMKTNQLSIFDCTMVAPYPLLFFGGNISVRKDRGQSCIVVDNWIFFRSSKNIGNLIKELRKELDKLLLHKVTHPSVTNWDRTNPEGALMAAILDLITGETCYMETVVK